MPLQFWGWMRNRVFRIVRQQYSLIDQQWHSSTDRQPSRNIDRSSPANETFALPAHYYPSFDVATQPQTSIDYHYDDTISRQGDYSIGSWADDSLHESFAVDTELPEMKSDDYDEDYHREKNILYRGLSIDDRGLLHTSFADATSTSIDSSTNPSIDDQCIHHLSPPMHTSFILANIRYPGFPRNRKVLPAHQLKLNICRWLILQQSFAGYVFF